MLANTLQMRPYWNSYCCFFSLQPVNKSATHFWFAPHQFDSHWSGSSCPALTQPCLFRDLKASKLHFLLALFHGSPYKLNYNLIYCQALLRGSQPPTQRITQLIVAEKPSQKNILTSKEAFITAALRCSGFRRQVWPQPFGHGTLGQLRSRQRRSWSCVRVQGVEIRQC